MAKEPNTYHHIVPQCYLKNFAVKGKSDFVYVYDKVQNKSYTKAIKDIAGIDDFYTISPEFNDGTFDSKVIETSYLAGDVEGKYSKVLNETIESIKNGSQLTDNLKMGLAIHIAIQFLRTKEVREKDEQSLNDFLPDFIELFKEGLSLEKKDPKIAELNISYKYDSAMHHFRSSFGNEEIINIFAGQLASNYWNFYYSTTPVFYTSHFPIVVSPHVPNARPLCLGLTQYGAELSFPISPNIVLVIWEKDYFKEKASTDGNIVVATDEDIRKYNWMRYLYAEQVYSHTNDFSALDFIYKLNGKHEFFKYK